MVVKIIQHFKHVKTVNTLMLQDVAEGKHSSALISNMHRDDDCTRRCKPLILTFIGTQTITPFLMNLEKFPTAVARSHQSTARRWFPMKVTRTSFVKLEPGTFLSGSSSRLEVVLVVLARWRSGRNLTSPISDFCEVISVFPHQPVMAETQIRPPGGLTKRKWRHQPTIVWNCSCPLSFKSYTDFYCKLVHLAGFCSQK